jgi:hypothetical protein
MESQIFNTDHLQIYPDFFREVPPEPLKKKNSNVRYKFFKQNHYTSGDEDQFLEFWDRSTPMIDPCNIVNIDLNHSIPMHKNIRWSNYRDLCVDDVINTYHYISEKFKKGIFLKITDGIPKVFLPFSKIDFQNEWSEKIKLDARVFSNIIDLMKFTAKL